MSKVFEDFEPIFGKLNAEWENPSSSLPSLDLPFLLHIHAVNSSTLRIHLTDFHSYTWESTKSVPQLEDLRDDVGIGGSLSEFVDYLVASLKSDNVKLVLGGFMASSRSEADRGATVAKLIAHKSQGMPLVTISLVRLMKSSDNDAMASLCLELYEAFKRKNKVVVQEQERSYQLTRRLSAEKEKNSSIQNQLDVALFSKNKKLRESTESDKALPMAIPISNFNASPVTVALGSPLNKLPEDRNPSKVNQRVVPAHRRAKNRGAILIDSDDENGN
ncbi:hypothetical protein MKW94_008211 [Papaver nudicaule]|uniref:Uncharacterized protein n=1 Tax=Papaver nudicaule TaxID=74823 RepID=A0AA41S7A5_PAPNU|nr:hypothetical protein [Papaver nudicaule]